MIKVSMLAALFAGLAMGGNTAIDSRPQKPVEKRDTQIIVEVDRSLDTLTEEGVKNVQNAVYNNIRNYVTRNTRMITSYHVLNNAFAMSINSKYVDSVKALPGVKSVTVNKIHFVTETVNRAVSETPDPEHDYGGKDNASAETMHLVEGATNDGEGTVIAILDNEFYFRADYKEGGETKKGFKHETFGNLGSAVKVRWTSRPDVTKLHPYSATDDDGNLRFKNIIDKTQIGKEGSLYYSRKIPYYFDYGGDPDYYSSDYDEDFDVSSLRSYHGSHVASIASGNSPYYKGIAPKAQLVCMKVFTNYKPNKTDTALGFSGSTGAMDIPILNALEDCITLGVDGINMSLGSDLDDFDADSITMKTLTRLHNAGILSSISAGNSGKSSFAFAGGYGNWTSDMVETGILGGYANQSDSMIIAAGQPGRIYYASAFSMDGNNIAYQDQVVNVGDSEDYEENEERRISDLVASEGSSLDWVYVPNFGSTSDYKDLDVTGKIAIVNRGSIDFATKVKNANTLGAAGVVVINNDPTATYFNFRCSFGDYKPPIPVALILYKDRTKFSGDPDGQGTFQIVKDKVDVNPKANKISDFSSDGASYNLDLKPDITAPGESIRGAVPPQTKEDKELRPLTTYEFLDGTSMSAPNYAGAQAVVLSKKAVELKNDSAKYNEYRNTVDMRLMSTAIPMVDYDDCPEDGHKGNLQDSYRTSPRQQGAGMANIDGAYRTNVYLEGLDLYGNGIGKSKIALRNSSKINRGTVSLQFLAHNESDKDMTYNASFTIMRPAIEQSNEIVTREYVNKHDIDKYNDFPGLSYWAEETGTDHITRIVERHTDGTPVVGNVYNLTREVKYNDVETDPVTGELKLVEKTIPVGRYCCTAIVDEKVDPIDGKTWYYAQYEVYKSSSYQSTQDILIKTSTPVQVVAKANSTTTITLPEESLTIDEKNKILEFYTYGTYLEGFVTLESQNGDGINLSMPWMGFFGGEGQDYKSAPVVEPFEFEKDSKSVYPSELVNDLGFSLYGKTNIDMGSSWVTTYVEPGKEFDSEKILSNDESLSHLAKQKDSKYYLLGADSNKEFYDNPSEHLYVGNPISSNTMIIQQFMLRSVNDNYFTITNKTTGEVVAKDVLKDMLFGERYGRYPLYKSHLDPGYGPAGYIAHRAFGVIPLYDEFGIPYEPGDYEITFNYQLAYDLSWISKSYTLHVLSIEPSISDVYNLPDCMRFYFNDKTVSSVKVGKYIYDEEMTEAEKKGGYIQLSNDRIQSELKNNVNPMDNTGRLFIELTNKAFGKTGIIVKFKKKVSGYDLSTYTIAEHHSFILSNDFEDLGNRVVFYKISGKQAKQVTIDDGYLRIKRSNEFETPQVTWHETGGGCGGNITTTSIILSSLAGVLALLVFVASKKRKGGKA